MTDVGRVLEVGRELRAKHLGKIDAIVAGDADVLRNPKAHLLELGQGSERCVIIRTHQDGRRLRKGHELMHCLSCSLRIMEGTDLLIHRIQLDTVLLQCSSEAIQSLLRNQGHLTMDETDFTMPSLQHELRKFILSFDVVGHYRALITKLIIDGDGRDLAVHELDHLRGCEIHAGDQDAVAVSVACMLQEAGLRAGDGIRYEGHIVAELFEGFLRAVENRGEVLMRKSRVCFIYKQDADIMRTVGFQLSGCYIRKIVHFLRCRPDPLSGLWIDIGISIQCLTDGRR